MNAFLILAYTSLVSPAVGLVLLVRRRSNLSREISAVRLLLAASILFDVAGLILSRLNVNNYIIQNIFYLIQFYILFSIYTDKFSGRRKSMQYFGFAMVALF